MKLIVLAAGRGTRLGKITEKNPKIMASIFEGRSLLDVYFMNLENLAFIDHLILVAGFGVDRLEHACRNADVNKPIAIEYNPFFSISGPLVSVWTARNWMRGDNFFLCNGDTFFSPQAFKTLEQKENSGIFLAVDSHTEGGDDGMRIQIDDDGFVRKVGKNLPEKDSQAVSCGLLLVKGDDLRNLFVATLENVMKNEANLSKGIVWHSILNHLAESGVNIEPVLLAKSDWHEVDTPKDLDEFRVKYPYNATLDDYLTV